MINNATYDKSAILNAENAKSFFKYRGSTTDINGKLKQTNTSDQTGSGNILFILGFLKNENSDFNKSNTVMPSIGKSFTSQAEEIIPYPRVEFTLKNVKSENVLNEKIILTPNSINGVYKKLGDKFYFGRTGGKLKGNHLTVNVPFSSKASNTSLGSIGNVPNDYDFKDESIGPRQFDITYIKEKNKFFVTDNRRGTGLFVKIKKNITIVQDIIASFCAVHMILQVENERKLIFNFSKF